MNKDTKRITKTLYNFANQHFDSGRIELCLYISNNITSIKTIPDISIDDYELVSTRLCDSFDEIYEEFASEFSKLCIGKDNRINCIEIEGSIFIELNDYALNTDKDLISYYYQVLENLCNSCEKDSDDYKSFPVYYEEFCKRWFQRYCSKVETTPKTNDKGIDLLGVFKDSAVIPSIAANVEVSFIAQVKLYSSTVDASVIRKIIGDALLLTFDKSKNSVYNRVNIFSPTIIFVIGHRGFTKEAQAFAKSKGIVLLDSKDLLRIIAVEGDLKQYDCIKYLDYLVKRYDCLNPIKE